MKKLLLLSLITLGFNANGQVLVNQDSSSLTIGNFGTDLTGATPGQGGWTTFVVNTAVPAGQNSDFQVVNAGGSYGNAIQLTGASSTTGTRWLSKNVSAEWAGRTFANDIAEVEFEFYTGPATTSQNTQRVVFYEGPARTKMLAGIMVIMDTKEVRGLAYLDPTTLGGSGAIGNYSLTLGGTPTAPAALILNADTWYKFGISFNYATGEVLLKDATALFDKAYDGAAALENVGELDILVGAGGTVPLPNTAASIGVFDNISARASATNTLLGVAEVTNTNAISMFPNPAKDMVTITSSIATIGAVSLTDINGRTVKSITNNTTEAQINISDLAQGVYVLKVTSNEGTVTTKKLVKE